MTDKKMTRREFIRILGSVSLMAVLSSLLPFNPFSVTGGEKTRLKDENGREISRVSLGRP